MLQDMLASRADVIPGFYRELSQKRLLEMARHRDLASQKCVSMATANVPFGYCCPLCTLAKPGAWA